MTLRCKGCGHSDARECCDKPGRPDCDPSCYSASEHCGQCPPWICDDCHETCSATDLCSCWTPLKGMPLADLKAIFAASDMGLDL